MAAPALNPEIGLDALRDDLVFLRATLTRDPRAKHLVEEVAALIDRWPKIHAKQLAHWDAQTEGQVDVVFADGGLDRRVDLFDDDLRRVVGGDRESPHYRQYIVGGAYQLKRPVLGAQLATLKDWEGYLADEEEPTLRAHRKPLSAEIVVADAAVKTRAAADLKNTAFRTTGELAKYVQSVLQARDRVWSELERQRTAPSAASLPSDWADGFFRPKPAPTLTEAERADRAAAREKSRAEGAELARKRKELSDTLKATKKELAELGKKPRKK